MSDLCNLRNVGEFRKYHTFQWPPYNHKTKNVNCSSVQENNIYLEKLDININRLQIKVSRLLSKLVTSAAASETR